MSLKILIVDDSNAILEMMKHLLGGFSHEVLTAENGQEALTLLKNEKIDLVISDLEMPVMNGIVLGLELRKFNTTTPIFYYSGHPKLTKDLKLQTIEKTLLIEDKKTSQLLNAINALIQGDLFT